MPKHPRSYSDADVIRIWCNHLTTKEQVISLFVFIFLMPEVLTDSAVGSVSEKLLRTLARLKRFTLSRAIRRAVLKILSLILDKKVVKVITECYNNNTPKKKVKKVKK